MTNQPDFILVSEINTQEYWASLWFRKEQLRYKPLLYLGKITKDILNTMKNKCFFSVLYESNSERADRFAETYSLFLWEDKKIIINNDVIYQYENYKT